LAHQTLDRLPHNFIQREVDYAFVNGVKEQEVKQHFLTDGESSFKTDNQALKLEDAKAAAGPPARVQELRSKAPMGTRSLRTELPLDWARMLAVRGQWTSQKRLLAQT
jgi:hypothetical protein